MSDTKSSHVTKAGANIFAELGFPAEEAAQLALVSNRIISDKLAIKENLMSEISVWMKTNKLKQFEAAEVLGVTRPRVSDIVQKKSKKFSIDMLIDMLTRTGKHVQVSVV